MGTFWANVSIVMPKNWWSWLIPESKLISCFQICVKCSTHGSQISYKSWTSVGIETNDEIHGLLFNILMTVQHYGAKKKCPCQFRIECR